MPVKSVLTLTSSSESKGTTATTGPVEMEYMTTLNKSLSKLGIHSKDDCLVIYFAKGLTGLKSKMPGFFLPPF